MLVSPKTLDDRHRSLRLMQADQLARVRSSILRHGVLHPLVVHGDSSGQRVLLDGFKRLDVALELGHKSVPIRALQVSETEAKAAVLTCNAKTGGLTALEEAWVIQSLVREHQLGQKQVAELLGRHITWISRRLLLVEQLDGDVQQDMRLGLVTATCARELARLPRGNQSEVARAVHLHGLTSRQSAQLVDRVRHALPMPEAVRQVLSDPLKHVTPKQEATRFQTDPRLSEAGQELRRWLVKVQGAANGLCYALGRHGRENLAPADHQVVRQELALPTTEAITKAHQALDRFCRDH